MSDNININPTPIQRNTKDVATELTLEYYKLHPDMTVEEIAEVYTKFYATAYVISMPHYSSLTDFVSADLKELIAKMKS